jgi:23S rRNA pseudouridine1911/1915/1917 synthase
MSGDHFEWPVDAGSAGMRLDRFLAARNVLGTRSQVHHLIADGHVRVGTRAVKPGTLLRAGECVIVDRPPAVPSSAQPTAIALDVLYEDDALLAINKPPGLVVHPAPGHWQDTLVNALLHRWRTAPSDLDPSRLGIVHRLDKDTSGVLLIARTAASVAALSRQFQDRTTAKQYVALVWGVPRPARGTIRDPIGRHPVHRQRMAVRPRGRPAVTRYEVVESFDTAALVRAYPETGRTHQIRVHLAARGHPLVGDRLYARGRARDAVIARQALHAERIRFAHPVSRESIEITAPLPADLADAIAALRARTGR